MTTRLRLLGRARVFDGDRWLEAPYDKRFALLAYLARNGGEVDRGRLAFLFWPDVEETRSRRDLRHLIYRTKSLSFAADLQIGATSLAWQVETDVESLERATAQRDWAAVVNLYEGRFLEGMNIGTSTEFMSWLELEREGCHDLWRAAVKARVAELEATSRHDDASVLLRRLVDDDELDEEALRLYLRSCYTGGRGEEALRSYQRFERELQRGLGLEPLPATQEVAAALRDGQPLVGGSPAAREPLIGTRTDPGRTGRVRNLPSEITSFVGRDRELTEIVDLLNQPSCRLLTLLGPGGIGKTRLAQEAALSTAAGYGDGAVFVPLASVDKAAWLAPTIADALSLSFYDHREPLAQLSSYLRDKELLVVLDNLEQLPEGISLIASLLADCPLLQILATSRERLNLTREWLFRVEGLSLASSEESATLAGGDAAQLFVRCARRVRPNFVLNEVERSSIVRICQLVGGAPLAIELAAGWLEMLSCREIAETMAAEGLDFLVSSLHDVPARHRSLREVFEHSWRFLAPAERTAFARLSVFRGGFTRAAAAAVTYVGTRPLRSLLEKSLVTRDPSGRFDLHELAKQYAAEKLSEAREAEDASRDRHTAYFAGYLHERESRLQGGDLQETSLLEVSQEIDNVRRAWEWAVGKHDSEALELAASCLRFYCQTRGLYREGEEAFRHAADSIVEESGVRGRLLLYQALFTYWLRRLDEAKRIVELSLATLQVQQASPAIMANANFLLGLIQRDLGDSDRAKQQFVEALALAVQAGDAYFEARSLQGLGWLAEQLGALDEAEHYYRQCIAVLRRSEDRYGLALALFNLGGLLERSARSEQARECYLAGLEAGRAVGSRLRIAEAQILLGRLNQGRGEYQQAEARYSECLKTVTGHDDEPFRLAVKHCLVGIAEALAGLGSEENALTLLTFAQTQGGPEDGIWDRAESLQERLAARLSEVAVTRAREQGRALRFAEMSALLRDWHAAIPD